MKKKSCFSLKDTLKFERLIECDNSKTGDNTHSLVHFDGGYSKKKTFSRTILIHLIETIRKLRETVPFSLKLPITKYERLTFRFIQYFNKNRYQYRFVKMFFFLFNITCKIMNEQHHFIDQINTL